MHKPFYPNALPIDGADVEYDPAVCPYTNEKCDEYDGFGNIDCGKCEKSVAEWEEIGGFEPWLRGYGCSNCGYETAFDFERCPNCKARMKNVATSMFEAANQPIIPCDYETDWR